VKISFHVITIRNVKKIQKYPNGAIRVNEHDSFLKKNIHIITMKNPFIIFVLFF